MMSIAKLEAEAEAANNKALERDLEAAYRAALWSLSID